VRGRGCACAMLGCASSWGQSTSAVTSAARTAPRQRLHARAWYAGAERMADAGALSSRPGSAGQAQLGYKEPLPCLPDFPAGTTGPGKRAARALPAHITVREWQSHAGTAGGACGGAEQLRRSGSLARLTTLELGEYRRGPGATRRRCARPGEVECGWYRGRRRAGSAPRSAGSRCCSTTPADARVTRFSRNAANSRQAVPRGGGGGGGPSAATGDLREQIGQQGAALRLQAPPRRRDTSSQLQFPSRSSRRASAPSRTRVEISATALDRHRRCEESRCGDGNPTPGCFRFEPRGGLGSELQQDTTAGGCGALTAPRTAYCISVTHLLMLPMLMIFSDAADDAMRDFFSGGAARTGLLAAIAAAGRKTFMLAGLSASRLGRLVPRPDPIVLGVCGRELSACRAGIEVARLPSWFDSPPEMSPNPGSL